VGYSRRRPTTQIGYLTPETPPGKHGSTPRELGDQKILLGDCADGNEAAEFRLRQDRANRFFTKNVSFL